MNASWELKMLFRVVFCAGVMVLVFTGNLAGEVTTVDSITITILYDNVTAREDLIPSWGFSCLIQGLEKTILFDTGADGPTLLANMKRLNLDPQVIDVIVLSHMHGDHTGGLAHILRENSNSTVFLLDSFSEHLQAEVSAGGGRLEVVHDPLEICEDALLTGEMGTTIPEQGLILTTTQGLVIITGCAHPGIVEMVEKSIELGNLSPHLVMGGFHLFGTSRQRIRDIINQFRDIGVQKVCPCHCTGPEAMEMFQKGYGRNYIPCGAGQVISLSP
jgi:7,8-dihydropterin-6-yl-methyl-4-(beta-D-ribofuranosyl)aminobenzene 5'-phosphate synthase